MTRENGQTLYCVFLALKVASDQNLPWQQAFKRPLKKDTVSTVVVSTSQLSVHLLACSFLRLTKLLIFRKWRSGL